MKMTFLEETMDALGYSICSDNPGVLKLIVQKKVIMLGIMDGDYCLVESPT